jgi:hypothetical protein
MKHPNLPFYEYSSVTAMQLHHKEIKFAVRKGETINFGWIGFKTEIPPNLNGREDENRLGRAYIKPADTKIEGLSVLNEEFILNESQFARVLKHTEGTIFYLYVDEAVQN